MIVASDNLSVRCRSVDDGSHSNNRSSCVDLVSFMLLFSECVFASSKHCCIG